MKSGDAIALASSLVKINTANPPGSESAAARVIAERLRASGVAVDLFELAPGRESLVARVEGTDPDAPALCLSGHLDTVGVGSQPWRLDPLGGELEDDQLWGRGSVDMKAGVAAMVVAFETFAGSTRLRRPLVLALSASEETDSAGARQLVSHLGSVGAIVVAEPTSGRVAIAHKGVANLELVTEGRSAHGSMPELGKNAIIRMTKALEAVDKIDLQAYAHRYLGPPTVNVGTIAGGSATNVVPDECRATVDFRLVPGITPEKALAIVQKAVGDETRVILDLELPAVEAPIDNPWLQAVIDASLEFSSDDDSPIGMPYRTDASVLAPALGNPPVAIVGPGDPELAHHVDERCSLAEIRNAQGLFERLCSDWTR